MPLDGYVQRQPNGYLMAGLVSLQVRQRQPGLSVYPPTEDRLWMKHHAADLLLLINSSRISKSHFPLSALLRIQYVMNMA
ncbi:hypothetical protein HZ326_0704 [Fusarium oxysporum f. sp. albedinis]|nr:hypothetical protein HZ326_0704 [Fusarium oxysporum f. sp. albedinis]